MGLLSIFSKKVNNFEQYTADLERLKQEESETEVEEEKIVGSQGAYFKATSATIDAMKNLSLGFGNAFRAIGFKPKMALFRLGAAKQVLFGGSSQDAMAIADANIAEMGKKVDQMNMALRLEKAQSNPVFQICIDKIGIVNQQKQLLKTLTAYLNSEKKKIEQEAQKAEKIVEELQEEFDNIRMDVEIIKAKRKTAQDRLYKRAA